MSVSEFLLWCAFMLLAVAVLLDVPQLIGILIGMAITRLRRSRR